jgi:hypothetical protein
LEDGQNEPQAQQSVFDRLASNVRMLHNNPKRIRPQKAPQVSLEITRDDGGSKLSRKWKVNRCPKALVCKAQQLYFVEEVPKSRICCRMGVTYRRLNKMLKC